VFPDGNVDVTKKLAGSITYEEKVVEVIFLKRGKEEITTKNIASCLEVHKLQGSPLEGLYNTLKGVWCPTLLQSSQWSGKLPPRVQQLLAELESAINSQSLDSAIDSISSVSSISSSSANVSTTTDINDVSAVMEPIDEIKFWRSLLKEQSSGLDGSGGKSVKGGSGVSP